MYVVHICIEAPKRKKKNIFLDTKSVQVFLSKKEKKNLNVVNYILQIVVS